jgi:hypothetical protein
MPCCCASNIKAAFFIGICLAVLCSLSIYMSFKSGETINIVIGFLNLVNASFLIYGAHTRNAKAMLIYIGFAIPSIIFFIVGTALGIVEFFLDFTNKITISKFKTEACEEFKGTNDYQPCLKTGVYALKAVGVAGLVFIIVIFVGIIIFDIWTIIVAKNAKKEIEAEKSTPVENLAPISS